MANVGPHVTCPSRDELIAADCYVPKTDGAGDGATRAFKMAARLHQARWREARGHEMGREPIRGGEHSRPLGSRLPLERARASNANFMDERVVRAVEARIAAPERHQNLDKDRLRADLLSSMPFCFNLFGSLATPERATEAIKAWWPDVPGRVRELKFEWSPGRKDPAYLGNCSAFDAAFILELDGGGLGILAIETKYHEHPTAVDTAVENLPRYEQIAVRSGLFRQDELATLARDLRSQLWLDHLLALSLLQHESAQWRWARFVLVHPDGSPAWAELARHYASSLVDRSTFGVATFDELVRPEVLGEREAVWLRERYRCWG